MAEAQPVHRILVLDDDEIMRSVLEMLLSLEGCAITLASSGEAALGLLAREPAFDLVLTDLQMPGLQEAALAQALREAMPPKTLLFGMSGSPVRREIRDLFDAFLPKPFEIQLFWDAIKQAHAPKVRE